VEDSAIGLSAARAAGIATIVTLSSYTEGETFDGASAVLSGLGEPGAAARAFSGVAPPGGIVDLAYLRALAARPAGASA
jgi:hypothetical protein